MRALKLDHKPAEIDDKVLLRQAQNLLKKFFKKGKHHVACVLVADDDLIVGLHLDSDGIDQCAEPVAIANAVLQNKVNLSKIVSVWWDGSESNAPVVVAPCSNCRQLLLEFAPDMRVLVPDGKKIIAVEAKHLLPFPYIFPGKR